jgi:hypothetical protein
MYLAWLLHFLNCKYRLCSTGIEPEKCQKNCQRSPDVYQIRLGEKFYFFSIVMAFLDLLAGLSSLDLNNNNN